MKIVLASAIALLLFSCGEKAYINNDLKFTKTTDDCSQKSSDCKVESSLYGQHYTFQECLAADFSGKEYSVSRNGDTVFVNFTVDKTATTSLYDISLNIDAFPKYHYIAIDGKLVGAEIGGQ